MKKSYVKRQRAMHLCSTALKKVVMFSAPDSEPSYSGVNCSLHSRQHSAENRPWASILEHLIQIKPPPPIPFTLSLSVRKI